MGLYFNRRKAFRSGYTPGASTLRNTLGLNGSSEYATIAADASVTFGDGTRSYVSWFEATTATATLFQHGNPANGAAYVDVVIGFGVDILVRAFNNAAAFTGQRAYRTDDPFPTSGVHCLGVTFDTWGTFAIYLDGVAMSAASSATGAPGTLTATSTFNIGRSGEGANYMDGSMGASYFFDKNLSAAEHAAIYNTGVCIQPADFSGHGNPIISGIYSNMIFGIPSIAHW